MEIRETSSIKARGNGYSDDHRQISDAMEKAINWLVNQPVRTKVTIIETTEIERIG